MCQVCDLPEMGKVEAEVLPAEDRHPVRNLDIDFVKAVNNKVDPGDQAIDDADDGVKRRLCDGQQRIEHARENLFHAVPRSAPVSCEHAPDKVDDPAENALDAVPDTADDLEEGVQEITEDAELLGPVLREDVLQEVVDLLQNRLDLVALRCDERHQSHDRRNQQDDGVRHDEADRGGKRADRRGDPADNSSQWRNGSDDASHDQDGVQCVAVKCPEPVHDLADFLDDGLNGRSKVFEECCADFHKCRRRPGLHFFDWKG